MRMSLRAILAAALLIASAGLRAAAPLRVMILDGESGGPYHQWQIVTPVLKKQLDQTGLFDVDVVTAPPAGASFAAFKPDFGKYAAVVLNKVDFARNKYYYSRYYGHQYKNYYAEAAV